MPKGIYPRPVGYRPRKTDPPDVVVRVKALYGAGHTQAEIAELTGMGRKLIQGIFRRNRIQTRPRIKRNQWGPNNPRWKGQEATYVSFHDRVYRARGRPFPCSICGTTTAKKYDWANLTGNYSDLADFAAMCRSCHWRYDKRVMNLHPKVVMPNP